MNDEQPNIHIDHELFERAVYNGLHDAVWTLLPNGSHLVLYKGDGPKRGAEVFAFRHLEDEGSTEVLTERGDRVCLSDERALEIGKY